jgi:drug/metabolite transporter (DMT)-like permease
MALPSRTSSEHTTLTGMGLAATAFALLTLMDVIFKLIAVGHPAFQILVVNGCFAMVPIFIWMMATGGIARLYTSRLPHHLVRGSVSVLSALAAIYAYSRVPLTDFYAIAFAGPLIVTILSAFWLGEKVDGPRWLAILIGFVGILIVSNPFGAHSDADAASHGSAVAGRFAAFISVFCYALSTVMVRRMRVGESNMSFSFYGYVCAVTIGGCLLLLQGGTPFSAGDIAHLALSGILAGVASMCLNTAYHRTPASLVAPFQYTQLFWGAVAGYLLWSHLPDPHLVLGAIIVAVSGFYVIYRELRIREAAG